MVPRYIGNMMEILLFSITITSLHATNNIMKSFHHRGDRHTLEQGKVVFYFDKKSDIVSLDEQSIDNKSCKKRLFLPETVLAAGAVENNIITTEYYSISFKKGKYKGQEGLYVEITYQSPQLDLMVDTTISITRQPALIITFINKNYLDFLKEAADNPILTMVYNRPPTILVDCGHGGSDAGAIGNNGLCEKDVVLKIGKFLEDECIKRGWHVVMTRRDDTFISLDKRTAYAQENYADILVSIHANHASNNKAQGIETFCVDRSLFSSVVPLRNDFSFYQSSSDNLCALGKKIAQTLHDEIVTTVSKKYPIVDRKVKYAIPQVLLGAQIPGILIEVGFVSHPQECKRLADSAYQKLLAESIAHGIENYLQAA